MVELDEISEEFLVESSDAIDRLDEEFVQLEKEPDSEDLLGSIFCTVHTIKGTSSFLDFHKLEKLAHAGENVLSLLREGDLVLDARITSALLEMVDGIRETLVTIETEGTDAKVNHSELIDQLVAMASSSEGDGEQDDGVETDADVETPQAVEAEVAPQTDSEPPSEEGSAVGAGGTRSAADSSIRVDVDLLDHLMNLVSELVLARNQIRQFGLEGAGPGYENATQQLDLLTSDLQQAVMATRMQPVSFIFSRLPRMVRDVAVTCDKKVQLEMSGGDTELDKTLLEAIRDPLTHIVRNAVDHGLELPEDRIAAGKPETGQIRIHAEHAGGQVIVTLTDDGKGFDLERIAEKAIEKGLVTEEAVESMNDRELANLAFHPGLSTAETVTTVSGRGVGMDVVSQRVGEIGGAIEIDTVAGVGTTVTLRIPLTLAIIPALRVVCGGRRFLIPQVNVVELHHVESGTGIETVGNAPVYRLRGELLPLVSWREVLGDDASLMAYDAAANPDNEPDRQHIAGELGMNGSNFICVVKAHGLDFGFVVDKVESTEEIVVKPLPAHVKEVVAFAGSAVLGDGSVALILDPVGLTKCSGLNVDADEPRTRREAADAVARETDETVLVCEVGDRRIAFGLDEVSRLETFTHDELENAAGETVVQYRGSLMPIVDLQPILGTGPSLQERGDQV